MPEFGLNPLILTTQMLEPQKIVLNMEKNTKGHEATPRKGSNARRGTLMNPTR